MFGSEKLNQSSIQSLRLFYLDFSLNFRIIKPLVNYESVKPDNDGRHSFYPLMSQILQFERLLIFFVRMGLGIFQIFSFSET